MYMKRLLHYNLDVSQSIFSISKYRDPYIYERNLPIFVVILFQFLFKNKLNSRACLDKTTTQTILNKHLGHNSKNKFIG